MILAVRTRPYNIDYSWSSSTTTEQNSQWYHESSKYCDTSLSVAVTRQGELFKVFLGGISSEIVDFSNTKIRIGICIGHLSDAEARAVSVWFLKDIEQASNTIRNSIRWLDNDSWEVNFEQLALIIKNSIQELSLGPSPKFSDAWERIGYDRKALDDSSPFIQEAIINLCEELCSHSFSSLNGLKLLVTRFPIANGELVAREQADRLLWQADTELNLTEIRKKKKKLKLDNHWITKDNMILCSVLGAGLLIFCIILCPLIQRDKNNKDKKKDAQIEQNQINQQTPNNSKSQVEKDGEKDREKDGEKDGDATPQGDVQKIDIETSTQSEVITPAPTSEKKSAADKSLDEPKKQSEANNVIAKPDANSDEMNSDENNPTEESHNDPQQQIKGEDTEEGERTEETE